MAAFSLGGATIRPILWPKLAVKALRPVRGGAFRRLVLHDGDAGPARTVVATGCGDALRIIRRMEISMGGFLGVFGFQFRRTCTPGAQRATEGDGHTSRDHDGDDRRGDC